MRSEAAFRKLDYDTPNDYHMLPGGSLEYISSRFLFETYRNTSTQTTRSVFLKFFLKSLQISWQVPTLQVRDLFRRGPIFASIWVRRRRVRPERRGVQEVVGGVHGHMLRRVGLLL